MQGPSTTTPEDCLAPTLAALGDRPRTAIDRLAGLGFRAVQLSASQPGLRPRELDRSGRRDLKTKLSRLAMAPAGLDLWLPEAHLRDPARADRAIATIQAAVELAADLGRVAMSLMLPAREDAVSPITAILDAVVEKALRFGVPLADCAVPPSDRAEVGVGIDPAFWMSHGRNPVEAVRVHADRLRSVRLSDLASTGERVPAGSAEEGRLDLPEYRAALQAHGYDGPVVVDLRGRGDPWGDLEQVERAWGLAGLV